ncbi:MAG: histone deacetylase, partial [Planctomycetes bacterium]|nr:histone deacetylase [Planctomycetota bacterium]
LEPGPATMEDLLRVHTEEYLDMLKNFGEGPLDPDTYSRPETWEIASLAAGGGVLAGDTAFAEKRPVFALLRPPGHHATAFRAMGFCYLNNIAISGAKIVAEGKGKVAMVDIDLHHGNGTNDSFLERDDVLYVSTHQYPHYPGSGTLGAIGEGKGEGYTVNLPFPAGCGDATFEYAFETLIEPVVTQFEPSMIMVSIGGDSHYSDPLGGLTLSSQGYMAVIDRLLGLSRDLCEGRISFYLEGGYNVDALAEIISGIVARFHGETIEYRYQEVRDKDRAGKAVVDKVAATLKDIWKL